MDKWVFASTQDGGQVKRKLLSLAIFLIVFYFVAFVWPTPYRYDHIGAIPIRTDRVTSRIQFCSLQGWVDQLPVPGNASLTFRPQEVK